MQSYLIRVKEKKRNAVTYAVFAVHGNAKVVLASGVQSLADQHFVAKSAIGIRLFRNQMGTDHLRGFGLGLFWPAK